MHLMSHNSYQNNPQKKEYVIESVVDTNISGGANPVHMNANIHVQRSLINAASSSSDMHGLANISSTHTNQNGYDNNQSKLHERYFFSVFNILTSIEDRSGMNNLAQRRREGQGRR